MNDSLAAQHCTACRSDAPPVSGDERNSLLVKLDDGWCIVDDDTVPKLQREFAFADFAGAMAFAITVGELAEEENHHPTIIVRWGATTVLWWTHKIHNLHHNDFILAARCDRAYHAHSH